MKVVLNKDLPEFIISARATDTKVVMKGEVAELTEEEWEACQDMTYRNAAGRVLALFVPYVYDPPATKKSTAKATKEAHKAEVPEAAVPTTDKE